MTDKSSYGPSVLRSLRDRCRAATGPDRELDARIWAEFDGRDVREGESCLGPSSLLCRSRQPPHDECVAGFIDIWNRFHIVGQQPELPRYTASIDAAVALIERVLPAANCHGYDKEPDYISAFVSRNYVRRYVRLDEHAWLVEAEHPTSIPLALLLALLSALIERGDGASMEGA